MCDSTGKGFLYGKRYKARLVNKKEFIIEYTEEQDIDPEEDYAGMEAHEFYIIDENGEYDQRVICYYDWENVSYGADEYNNYAKNYLYLEYRDEFDDKVKIEILEIVRM